MRERGREGKRLQRRQQSQTAPLSREVHCQNPSLLSFSCPTCLAVSFYFASSFPRTFCRLKLPKEENILAIRRKERAWVLADIFIKALQPVCPVRKELLPTTGVRLYLHAFVPVSMCQYERLSFPQAKVRLLKKRHSLEMLHSHLTTA